MPKNTNSDEFKADAVRFYETTELTPWWSTLWNQHLAGKVRYLSTMPRKIYTEQFKRDAVSLYESTPGATLNTIASGLGVNRNWLHIWLDTFGSGTKTNTNGDKVASPIAAANSTRTPTEGLSDVERIRVLERENTKLREEREILRKAAKYFA